MKMTLILGALSLVASTVCASPFKMEETSKMNYEIKTQIVEAQPALVIKGKVKIEEVGETISAILGKLEAYLTKQNMRPVGAPFTRTFNFADGIIEFESGFPVKEKIPSNGEVIGTELPKGLVASTIHVGTQETSQEAYEAIHVWMEKNHKKEAGAPWEVYLTDPASTPPEKNKLQVFFPIR